MINSHAMVNRISRPMPAIKNITYRTKCLWLFTPMQLSTHGQWLRRRSASDVGSAVERNEHSLVFSRHAPPATPAMLTP